MQTMSRSWAGIVGVFFLTACGPELGQEGPEPLEKVELEERIDYENDPNRFQLTMTRKLAELPSAGESERKPFPSNWWPMRKGGIAWRWLGESVLSPAEKYDFLTDRQSIRPVTMTLAQKDYKGDPVNEGAQPETFEIGKAAEWEHKNHGRYGARDPESWYGHCNGWASYVINEDEPMRPVSVRYDAATRRVTECAAPNADGCVKFELGDINALGAELYWADAARMLGRRCEDAESDFTFDAHGRVDKVECRDGNAGSFHLVVTNMLGRLNRPFIVDLTADREVWNFPVYKYEITRNEEISLQAGLREMGLPEADIANTSAWPWNADAAKLVRVHTRLWIVEDSIPPSTEPAGHLLARYTTIENYDYILELDAQGSVIGGEWVGRSKTKHPDFLWYSFSNSPFAASTDDLTDRDNPHIRFSVFKQILTLSQNPPAPPEGVVRKQVEPKLPIPDGDQGGTASTLSMSETFTAASVTARVRISHTYRGDLRVVLSHAGRSVVLHNQEGGSQDNLDLAIAVPELAGRAVTGDWTLAVYDLARQDTGILESWGLDFLPDGGGNQGGGQDAVIEQSAQPNAAIPDNDPTGVSSGIDITDDFTPTRVRVSVDITHTYRGDLQVVLEKDGATYVLHDKQGGSADDLKATFEVPGFQGTARGRFNLIVRDLARADTGTLRSWTLELTRSSEGGQNGGGQTVTRELEVRPNLAIPDNSPTGVAVRLEATENLTIQDLKVEVAIAHPYIGDLRLELEKDGVKHLLHDRQGGSADDIRRTFDTRGFASMNLRGTWVLRVSDHASRDTGSVERVKLIATGTN